MKKIQIITIMLFFIIFAVPVLSFNIKQEQISEIDNRTLAELPELSEWEEREWTAYFEDRVGFRNEMIKVYTIMNDSIFDVMVHPTYQYGEDGYVFFRVQQETVNKEYLEKYAEFLLQMQEDCEEQGIVFQYWLNPSKSAVYDEYLPKGVNLRHEHIVYLLSLLDEKHISYTHSLERLREYKKVEQVYNKQYDAGHWNDTGAFRAFQGLYIDLIEKGVYIENIEIDNYEFEEQHFTMLPVSFFPIEDSAIKFIPKINDALWIEEYENPIEMHPTFHTFAHYQNPAQVDRPRVLVFRGSYLNEGRSKFLLEQFSEVTIVHNYHNVQKYQEYINLLEPDVVIFECADYVINESYFPLEPSGIQ